MALKKETNDDIIRIIIQKLAFVILIFNCLEI